MQIKVKSDEIINELKESISKEEKAPTFIYRGSAFSSIEELIDFINKEPQ